jgi:predicted nucleic acid-binding protein
MYLLGRMRGSDGQDEFWSFLFNRLILLHLADDRELRRMRELMFKYRDLPMDLADASLVAAAESLGTQRILTLDRHFHAYRVDDRQPFEILV